VLKSWFLDLYRSWDIHLATAIGGERGKILSHGGCWHGAGLPEGFCPGKLSLSLARRSLGEGGWFPLCLPFPPTSDIRLLTSTMFAPQFILWHAVASQRRHRQNRTHPRFWILPAADERRFVICLPSSVSTSYFRFSFVPRHSSPTRRAQFSTRGSFINTTSLEL
jgi:hypothetical protein